MIFLCCSGKRKSIRLLYFFVEDQLRKGKYLLTSELLGFWQQKVSSSCRLECSGRKTITPPEQEKKSSQQEQWTPCTFANSFTPEPQTVSGQQQSSNTAHNIQTTRLRGRLCRACRFKAGHMKLCGLLRIYLPVIFPTLKYVQLRLLRLGPREFAG